MAWRRSQVRSLSRPPDFAHRSKAFLSRKTNAGYPEEGFGCARPLKILVAMFGVYFFGSKVGWVKIGRGRGHNGWN